MRQPTFALRLLLFLSVSISASLSVRSIAKAQCTGGAYYTTDFGGAQGVRDFRRCNDQVTWNTAQTNCANLPGGGYRLATMDDAAEESYLTGISANQHWIGYNDIATEGAFVWDGIASTSGYVNATITGTNNLTNNCVRLNGAGTWTVTTCGTATNRYWCEDVPRCGNAIRDTGEGCDDGNNTSGDGCSSTCTVELEYTCTSAFPNVCSVICSPANRVWFGINGGSEYYRCTTNATWTNANTACGNLGSGWYLAKVESLSENSTILSTVVANTYIGYTDAAVEGTFLWTSDGSAGSFTLWYDAQPDDGGGVSDCAYIGTNGMWYDGNCATGGDWVCEGPAICGNGVRGGSEQCDDGNTNNADLCANNCTLNSSSVCGDGAITGSEECDDGDTTNGDGCNASCAVEPGYECVDEPSICTANCTTFVWDGVASGSEYYRCSTPTVWVSAQTRCQSLGSGWDLVTINDLSENARVQTLISANAYIGINDRAVEGTWVWSNGTSSYTNWATGEPNSGATVDCGRISFTAGTWADATCTGTQAGGYVCEGPAICGNGVTGGTEECDDGNTDNADLCANDCTLNSTAVCGDGAINSPEACDDGDTTSGDGCSSTCTIEAGYQCTGTPSNCNLLCSSQAWSSYLSGSDLQTTEYYRCTTTANFASAELQCNRIGAGWNLASVTGGTANMSFAQENTQVRSMLSVNGWIGFNDQTLEGTFAWISGAAVTSTNWSAGEPNGGATQDCVRMYSGTGLWDNLSCVSTTGAFVCEGPPLCGNGVLASPEVCDDGDVDDGDGCSSTCTIESGYGCSPANPSVCSVVSLIGVDSLVAVLMPRGVRVEWLALYDPTSVAFEVFKSGASDRIKVSRIPVDGGGVAPSGRRIEVVDEEGAASDVYWVVEWKADGGKRQYGPLHPKAADEAVPVQRPGFLDFSEHPKPSRATSTALGGGATCALGQQGSRHSFLAFIWIAVACALAQRSRRRRQRADKQ